MASPHYASARRRFHSLVIGLLVAALILAVSLPGWWGPVAGAALGIGGTVLVVWFFSRTSRRLEKDMRGWVRERTVTGVHVPGDED